jgi:uncharacterized protein (DUF58 family)
VKNKLRNIRKRTYDPVDVDIKEILKEIRRIEIRTDNLVNDLFCGEYHAVFKGRGMEFSEVREYQPGDDVRNIDWNVTARMGHPYVKKHIEERELTVMLLVDASSSLNFGAKGKKDKRRTGIDICALLAFSAIKNNDRVGLIIFTDSVEKFVPPKKGRNHVLRVILELLYFQPGNVNTDLTSALDYMNRILNRRAVVFIISDFITSGYDTALKIANKRHDIIPITLTDPRELALPKIGMIELEDAETGEEILIDTHDPEVRETFGLLSTKERRERDSFFKRMDIDPIDIVTDRSFIEPLMNFFRKRANRFR